MASAEMESQPRPQPLFWRHLGMWLRSIPRSAILSMVGPFLLCVLGYFGWRYYGAAKLDLAYYGLRKENVHLPPQPRWMRSTNVLDEVFEGSALSNLSLLDSQTPAAIARVFDAHPCVRKTHRVQRTAGQIIINLEYRQPVAMIALPKDEKLGAGDSVFYAVDSDSVLLDDKNFIREDIPNYITVFCKMEKPSELVKGKPFGDQRIAEAVRLCTFLLQYREGAKLTRLYVYPPRAVGKSRSWLELETLNESRIQWGSAPGLELPGENTASAKLKMLIEFSSDGKETKNRSIDLSGLNPNSKTASKGGMQFFVSY